MHTRLLLVLAALPLMLPLHAAAPPAPPPDLASQPANTWVKRTPLPGAPVSPRMGYEATIGYDPRAKLLIRWGGHNQGGGGEQNAETWTYDPVSSRWALKQPNDAPPGVCCGQQNVFDVARGRFVRFASFSGSHGWQWSREIALKNSSAWTYDLATNTWRDMRPLPEPRTSPLRCAAYDTDNEVIVIFGGEGNTEGTVVYDSYANAWTRMQPPTQPAFRSGGSMAYDEANKQFILFGAQSSDDPHTWAYSLTDNRWTDLKPAKLPPTNKNDAVLTYDPINKMVLAVLRVAVGKGDKEKAHLETWAFDVGKRAWTKMNPSREPTPSGNRARLLTFLPDHGVALLENRTHPPTAPAEQQVWTYRYAFSPADRDPPLGPPTGLSLTAGKEEMSLEWKRPSKATARYVVYRGEGEQPWKADLRRIGVVKAREGEGPKFVDRTVKPGVVYHYAVAAEDAKGRAGKMSRRARSQPPLVEEVVASVKSVKEVGLSWKAVQGAVGYHVERAAVEVWSEDELNREKKRTPPLKEPSVAAVRRIGPFETLTKDLVKEAKWTDRVDLEKPAKVEGKAIWERRLGKDEVDNGEAYRFAVYAYRVRAVNALGVKGGPSPYVLTIPSAPQHVFSRETGQTCDLKWAKNPESDLKGYRVYRLDGRFNNQPVSRLTAEPIAKTTFSDEKAGKVARRYHVVAVDAIGQEGVPSAPVWFEREWKSYYGPFVGEWHQ